MTQQQRLGNAPDKCVRSLHAKRSGENAKVSYIIGHVDNGRQRTPGLPGVDPHDFEKKKKSENRFVSSSRSRLRVTTEHPASTSPLIEGSRVVEWENEETKVVRGELPIFDAVAKHLLVPVSRTAAVR